MKVVNRSTGINMTVVSEECKIFVSTQHSMMFKII